jgi:hypothetical protein
VIGEDDSSETRIYIIIALIIILAVIFAVVFSGFQFKQAYIHHDFLDEKWFENLVERDSGSNFLGLEKWESLTYELDSDYTAYLTITTIKTFVMMDEKELRDAIEDTVEKAFKVGISLDNNTKINGERMLKNGHKTLFIIYKGNDTSDNINEQIRIIGEVWNCGKTGTSIICLGFSQISDNKHNKSEIFTTFWEKIIGDEDGTFGNEGYKREDGLIYNVICH